MFTGWLRLDAIQRLKLRGKVMTTAIASWSCTPAGFSIVDWIRYIGLRDSWSIAQYSFVAEGRKVELRTPLSYGCPDVPPDSLKYARRDPTVTNVSEAEEAGILVVGIPFLALTLLRFGVLRIRDGFLALHLLRTGALVAARRENVALPGHPPAVLTSAEVAGRQLLVITPAPLILGDRQNLLVDPALRTVAWDLLPFIPAAQGALGVPSMKGAFPRALAPIIALFALVVPFIAW
jgi:hypothetical protein